MQYCRPAQSLPTRAFAEAVADVRMHVLSACAAQVSSLTSFDTELPYDYYSMPFCKPAGGVKKVANSANPGTILEGTRIETSPYNFTMKVRAMPQHLTA